jgi:peptidoglycan/LPS O-acetylase OafA/YrhL
VPISFALAEYPARIGAPPMFFSAAFLSDWVSGLVVAGTLLCFEAAFGNVRIPAGVQHAIQRASDCTFSLYLYHYPLVLFATAVAALDRVSGVYAIASGFAILALIVTLSFLTEARRNVWRRAFEFVWDATDSAARRIGTRLVAVFATSRVS